MRVVNAEGKKMAEYVRVTADTPYLHYAEIVAPSEDLAGIAAALERKGLPLDEIIRHVIQHHCSICAKVAMPGKRHSFEYSLAAKTAWKPRIGKTVVYKKMGLEP